MLQWTTRPLTTSDRSPSVEPEIVQGIEVEGKPGFDLGAAAADLLDRHRLEDHHFAVQVAEDLQAFGVALVVVGRRHPARL